MAQELPEGTVTVLFTDVEGSTDLTTRWGDEAAQGILRAQGELVRRQIGEHSGHEVKSLGDGFMVAFTSARRAVACAIAIQRALEQHNRRRPPDEQVRVRIGLNTGEVIREEADLFGEAVNAAARVAAKAKGGQILVSETVRGVMGRATDVELVDRGRFRLKGFPERWRLFEVVWQEERGAGPPAVLERTPFVGRETEMGELRLLLDGTARGQGALVMIGGEPGVGKTRLAEELAAEARQRGLLLLTGRCYEMEGAPPYIPFVEMLEAAARTFQPQALRDVLGDSAPEVAKLVPELRRTFPDIPPPPELPPEQERRYLFNGMRDFLARAGRAQPLVLVLDDLQWADESTLLLLQHIVQQFPEMPVLIVGTYRDVEVEVTRPLARALEELLRQRLAHRLALKRFPEAGVTAMLRALSGQDPPLPLVQAIYSETEGNPFFVEEVFKHLAEEGKLFDPDGRWRPGLQVSELDVPEGVRLVIERRLQRVSEGARRVLTAAAVIGRSFSFELLEALGEVEAEALLDAVDEAERAHLIMATPDGPEARFAFAHELTRQTLLSGVSQPRRQRLHLRVAEVMEGVYATTVEERAGDLANHLNEAGTGADPRKTAHYLALAGQRALAAAAFEDALRHFESALSLQPPDDRHRWADLLFKRGMARRSLGLWEEALADWRATLAIHEELGDAEAVGRVCSDITVQLLYGGRFLESLEIGRRGLTALGERASGDRCHLLAAGGLTIGLAGSYAAGDRMIGQALELARELGNERLLGEALLSKTLHRWAYIQVREAADAGAQAAELLRSSGHLWHLADALWITRFSLLSLGRLDEAARIGDEAEGLAMRLGHLGALLEAGRSRGLCDVMLTADLHGFEAFVERDLEVASSLGFGWTSDSYAWLGILHFWRGYWDKALENFLEAARLELPGFFRGGIWGLLFVLKAHCGDKDEALTMLHRNPIHVLVRRLLTRLVVRRPQWGPRLLQYATRLQPKDPLPKLGDIGDLPRPGQPSSVGAWAMLLAMVEGLVLLGKASKAAKLYPLVVEAIDTGTLIRVYGDRLLQTVAGMAAAAGRQWEEAEEHYRMALRLAHELPHRLEQPEVRRWYARMLMDRGGPGDRDKARQLLTEAVAMYRQIGMPRHVEMAEELLDQL